MEHLTHYNSGFALFRLTLSPSLTASQSFIRGVSPAPLGSSKRNWGKKVSRSLKGCLRHCGYCVPYQYWWQYSLELHCKPQTSQQIREMNNLCQTVWASNWGQWRCQFSAVASSESLSLLLCWGTGSDNTNTASVKSIMLALFHKPLPNWSKSVVPFHVSCFLQIVWPDRFQIKLFQRTKPVEEEGGTFSPCQGLVISEATPHFKVVSLISGQGLGIKDEPLCPSFHIAARLQLQRYLWTCVRRKNKCLWAPQGWQKSATDLPSQTQSWMALFQFCTRVNLLYKWTPDPWQQKESIPITLTNLAAGSTDEIKSQRDNHYFIF